MNYSSFQLIFPLKTATIGIPINDIDEIFVYSRFFFLFFFRPRDAISKSNRGKASNSSEIRYGRLWKSRRIKNRKAKKALIRSFNSSSSITCEKLVFPHSFVDFRILITIECQLRQNIMRCRSTTLPSDNLLISPEKKRAKDNRKAKVCRWLRMWETRLLILAAEKFEWN